MDRYEATFEIDSRPDADAARRILAGVYDAVREESRSVGDGSGDATDALAAFEALREAAREPAAGRLTVTYERDDGGFD
jgi:hypothetical protein